MRKRDEAQWGGEEVREGLGGRGKGGRELRWEGGDAKQERKEYEKKGERCNEAYSSYIDLGMCLVSLSTGRSLSVASVCQETLKHRLTALHPSFSFGLQGAGIDFNPQGTPIRIVELILQPQSQVEAQFANIFSLNVIIT